MTDLHHPASPPPPAYDYGYPSSAPSPMVPRRPSRAPWAVALVATLIAAGSLGFAIYARSSSVKEPADPGGSHISAQANDTPIAAQERVCGVLEQGYPGVVDAIHGTNEFQSTPWSDAGRVRASNVLVRQAATLADQLEAALSSTTPQELRSSVVELITVLRALSMTYRDHAEDEQMNGVGTLYNRSRHGALEACGMEN